MLRGPDDRAERSPLTPVIRRLEFSDVEGRPASAVRIGSPLTIKIHYCHTGPIEDPYFGLTFETLAGLKVFWVQTRLQAGCLPDLGPCGVVVCKIPRLPLMPGTYFVMPGCGSRVTQLDLVPRASQLQVVEADAFGTGRLPQSSQALVLVDAKWSIGRDMMMPSIA